MWPVLLELPPAFSGVAASSCLKDLPRRPAAVSHVEGDFPRAQEKAHSSQMLFSGCKQRNLQENSGGCATQACHHHPLRRALQGLQKHLASVVSFSAENPTLQFERFWHGKQIFFLKMRFLLDWVSSRWGALRLSKFPSQMAIVGEGGQESCHPTQLEGWTFCHYSH